MVISGSCKITMDEEISNSHKFLNKLIIIFGHKELIISEQGYKKLEEHFRVIFEQENRDLKHDQELKDVSRYQYCRGYDDGYNVGTSMNRNKDD